MRSTLVLLLFLWAIVGLATEVSLRVNFNPEDHTVSGTETIAFDVAPPQAYFVLLANLGREPNPHISGRALDATYPLGFDPSWTIVERVLWKGDGQEEELDYTLLPFPAVMQTYSLDDGIMRVELPEGATGTLVIYFRTRFPYTSMGEPGRLGDVYTWRFGWYPLLYPVTPETWEEYGFRLPAYDYSVELSLPKGWVAALPGDEVSREEGEERVTYRVHWDRPVRSPALYFAKEDELGSFVLEGKDFVIEGWYLPGFEEELRALATEALEILPWYGERFGECPYRRILLAMHPNEPGASFAADGIIFLSRWYFDRKDLTAKGVLDRVTRFVLAHELAHLWWGIGIGVDFAAENWLSEAFAQYLSISWYEEAFGAEGGNVFVPELKGFGEELLENYLGFVNLREHMVELPYLRTAFLGFDEAVVKPFREVRYHNVDYVRIYDKGYLVVRALASYLGEPRFREALKILHQRKAGGELTVEGFRAALEEVSGQDLGPFFSAWVTGEAQADYEVVSLRVRPSGEGGYESKVELRFRGEGPLPVEVVLEGEEEGQEKRITWTPSTEKPVEILTVTTEFRPIRCTVDPEHRVLDIDRLNNNYPRKFVVIFGKNDFPLDAYYLKVLDPATGAIQGGYMDRFAWAVLPQSRYVTGFVRYGRTGELNAWAQVRDDVGLIGALAWSQYLWTTPEVGMAGETWSLSGIASLGAFKLPDTKLAPFMELQWAEMVNDVYWGDISLIYSGGSWRFWISGGKEFRLAPRTYLQLDAGLGRATGDVPQLFEFGLKEFFTFQGTGRAKVSLRSSLWVPPWEEKYRVGDLFLLNSVTLGLFLNAARLDDDPWVAETGAVLVAKVEALGGFIQLNLVGGIVYPLLPELGEGKIFFGIASGS
jgi:hypothetical protein